MEFCTVCAPSSSHHTRDALWTFLHPNVGSGLVWPVWLSRSVSITCGLAMPSDTNLVPEGELLRASRHRARPQRLASDDSENPSTAGSHSAHQILTERRARYGQTRPHTNSRGQHTSVQGTRAGRGTASIAIVDILANASHLYTHSGVAGAPTPTWQSAQGDHLISFPSRCVRRRA